MARTSAARRRNRDYLTAHLSANPCVDCGEGDPVVLDFDHVRGKKSGNVVDLALRYTVSLEKLAAEIAKCDVRCANCHRRATKIRRGDVGKR